MSLLAPGGRPQTRDSKRGENDVTWASPKTACSLRGPWIFPAGRFRGPLFCPKERAKEPLTATLPRCTLLAWFKQFVSPLSSA